jgi:hypothetical protein
MNLKDIQQMETDNIKNWSQAIDVMLCNDKQKDLLNLMGNILKTSFNMMITPIALETLSGKTINHNLSQLYIDVLIALNFIKDIIVQTFNLFAHLCSGYFRKALEILIKLPIFIAIIVLYIALDLLITAASFVTRPIATLAYLAAVLGSFCFGAEETKANSPAT